MNIGIFTDSYYPQINGVVISTRTLKEELERQGHHVTVITVSDPNITQDQENILRLKSIPFAVLPNYRVGQLYSRRIMKKIKALNLDIIHTQTEFSLGIFARIVSKHLNIPIVHTYHTMYEDYTHYFSPRVMKKTAKKVTRKLSCYLCRTVDNVIVPTEKVERKLKEYGFNKRINVIPTGVNLRPFDPAKYLTHELDELRECLGINNHQVVMFVGRLAKEKSIGVIIDAMKEVCNENDNTKLVIVGDGPEMKHLKKQVLELDIESQVVFTGKVPWEQVGKYYQLADIFVSASTSETQGLTFIEAMAAKKAVVAKYDTNLIGTIKDDVNGKFFYEDESLGEVLLELLNNDLKRQKLSTNGYHTASDFSSESFGQSVLEVYKSTVQNELFENYEIN